MKPSNLLLNDSMVVKICDFSLSIFYDEKNLDKSRSGTCSYQPPEVVNRLGWRPVSDVWAIGIIMYELIMGTKPFYGANEQDLYDKISTYKNDLR